MIQILHDMRDLQKIFYVNLPATLYIYKKCFRVVVNCERDLVSQNVHHEINNLWKYQTIILLSFVMDFDHDTVFFICYYPYLFILIYF